MGNFVGPFFFLSKQAARYELGVEMMLTCIAIQVLCIIGLDALLWNRNRKRAAAKSDNVHAEIDGQIRGLNDETDLRNENFKVC